MGLFGRKKDDQPAQESVEVKASKIASKLAIEPSDLHAGVSEVILRPRITEKAAVAMENHAYTFEVSARATKRDVEKAVREIYKVTPVKVNMVNKKTRRSMSRTRGREVKHEGLKKAYVYLKEGDRIEIV